MARLPGLRGMIRHATTRGCDADGQVDEEDAPPSETRDVGLDERTAEDRPDDAAESVDRPEDAERRCELAAREVLPHQPEPLRQQDGARKSLQETQCDKHADRGCERAEQRGDREAGQAEQEHPTASEAVTETTAQDQSGAERQRIAADDPLQPDRR